MKLKSNWQDIFRCLVKGFLIMRITLTFILLSSVFAFSSNTYSQNTKLSLNLNQATVGDVFKAIEAQSEFIFFYRDQQIDLNRRVDINVKGESVEEILDQIFKGTDNVYKINDRQIIIGKTEKHLTATTAPVKRIFEEAQQQQKRTVSGTVKDEKGQPMPGVSVVVKGTTIGIVTDVEGAFTLSVPADAKTLQFSFVGMKPQEVDISGKTSVNVVLEELTVGLNEVVAVGYGTMKKSDLTGAVATVSAADFDKVPATNMLQALQGRSSGIQITTSSGLPGAGSDVIIRGIQSINGTNTPIYVVDGMITDNINNLNPNSIESLSVLKDASAAAIYGARAANGVILITTKRGEGKKMQISLNSYYGFQNESNLKLKLLTGDQFLELITEAYDNAGVIKPWTAADLPQFAGINTNWKDLISRTGIIQNYDLSVSGGNEKTNYYISADYLDQKGRVIGTGYKKYTLNFNSDHKINDWIKFGNSLNIYSATIDGDATQYATALRQSPLRRAYEDNGDYDIIRNSNLEHMNRNPIWASKNNEINGITKGLQGNLYLTVSPLKGLDLTARGTMDYRTGYSTNFTAAVPSYYGWEGSSINAISKGYNETIHWTSEFTANYKKTFNQDHVVAALLGYSLEENRYEYLTGSRTGTPNDAIRFLDAGDPTSELNTNGYSDWAFMSIFGRLNYTYKNKYLLSATLRRDGTSRLSEGHRFGVFPSAAIAWRASQEEFLKGIGFINDLKFRLSYGTLGNVLSISQYGTVSTLSSRNTIIDESPANGYSLIDAVNKNLNWESTRKKNLGIDFTGFNYKLYSTINLYIEDTYNLLFNDPIAYSAGLSGSPFINAGKVRNTGYEVELGYRTSKSDWTYDFSVNLSHNRNKVIDLGGRDLSTSGIIEGYPVRSFYGYKSNGIIRDASELAIYQGGPFSKKGVGDIALLDINGYDENGKLTGVPDGKIDAADRTIIRHKYSDLTYGALATVGYKNWILQVQLQGVQGFDLSYQPYGSYSWVALMTGLARNESAMILNRYDPVKNPNGTWPRLMKDDRGSNFAAVSDFWIGDASYLRVKNINLSYNFPQSLCSKLKMNQLSLFTSVENVYTFTKWVFGDVDTTQDPEGVPQPRTWTFGFKATF